MHKGTSVWKPWLAAPHDFLHGLLGGLLGPWLALAGVIGLVYLVTRQLPALQEVTGNDGTRHKAIMLDAPLEARATWARYLGELRGRILQIRARTRAARGL